MNHPRSVKGGLSYTPLPWAMLQILRWRMQSQSQSCSWFVPVVTEAVFSTQSRFLQVSWHSCSEHSSVMGIWSVFHDWLPWPQGVDCVKSFLFHPAPTGLSSGKTLSPFSLGRGIKLSSKWKLSFLFCLKREPFLITSYAFSYFS